MEVWESYKRIPVIYKILAGFILGIIAGVVVGDPIATLKPLGDLLIRLLKMIVAPIVFFSLVVGAASISPARLGRVGVKIVVYYLVTSVVAVTIGIVMARVFQPGAGVQLPAQGENITVTKPSPVEVILNIVPTNPFAALVEGEVLQIIFFAIVLGIALAYVMEGRNERASKAAKTVYEVFDGIVEAIYGIVYGILEYMPIGVFALIGYVVAKHGPGVLGPLGKVVVALYAGLFLHIVLSTVAYSGHSASSSPSSSQAPRRP